MDYSTENHGLHDYGAVPPTYSSFDQNVGPHPKAEPGVKFRPLAFYDQVEPVLKTSKIPGNGTRLSGTTFYIRIEKADMEKFISGQVSHFSLKFVFSKNGIFRQKMFFSQNSISTKNVDKK